MIQYYHQKQWDITGTIAIKTPTKDELHQMFITHSNATLMSIGMTIKSEKDQFVKKTGRQFAFKHMTIAKVELKDIEQDGTKHIYHLYTRLMHNNKTYYLWFYLTTVAESPNVRLIKANLGVHNEKKVK